MNKNHKFKYDSFIQVEASFYNNIFFLKNKHISPNIFLNST